jgi:hypothetical protein
MASPTTTQRTVVDGARRNLIDAASRVDVNTGVHFALLNAADWGTGQGSEGAASLDVALNSTPHRFQPANMRGDGSGSDGGGVGRL